MMKYYIFKNESWFAAAAINPEKYFPKPPEKKLSKNALTEYMN